MPLEHVIGVRVPDPQQCNLVSKDPEGLLFCVFTK